LLFLLGCIPARLLITYVAKIANKTLLRLMGFVALVPVVVISYYAISGTRNNLGTFGEKIWWQLLRPLHVLLFLCFAYYAIIGNRCAYIYLLADTLISLVSFLYVHSSNGDFSKTFL
jgi:hypothetical protein